jgi:hypothetical protein
MCTADRDTLIGLADRFEASDRLVAQGRQLIVAVRAVKAGEGDSGVKAIPQATEK